MAVTVVASSSGRALGATTLTVSHTVPAGTDRYLVVLCNISDAPTINSATYGGVALTKTNDVTSANNSGRLVTFELANPTVGTADFVITVSASASLTASVNTLTDCNGFSVLTTAEGSSTTPSVTISNATNGLVLDIFGNALNNATLTVGAGQTSIVEQESIADANRKLAVSSESGAASVTMSWTSSISGAWIIGAFIASPVSIAAASARITQFGAEILSQPIPDARVTQFGVEILSSNTIALEGRVTQFGVEILSSNVVAVVSAEVSYAYLE